MDDVLGTFARLSALELEPAKEEAAGDDTPDNWRPVLPPMDAEPGACAAERLLNRKPDGLWRYSTAEGATAFHVARINGPNGSKKFFPISWCDGAGWKLKAWPAAWPLYNLPEITARPDAPVVVCEGEKAAEAAARVFPESVVTTSSGGSGAPNITDWQPLAGRRVLIWPDCDEPGTTYAAAVATALAGLGCSISIVDACTLAAIGPNGSTCEPKYGWDAADAVDEGRPLPGIRRDAVACAKPFDPGPAYLSFGGFKMTNDGLTVEIEKGGGENKTLELQWISAPFEILGACRDRNGRGWGKYLRWFDADQRVHVQHVADAALQGDPAPLCAGLASDGLRIARAHQRHLVSYLSSVRTSGRATIVSRTGWHEIHGQNVFVLAEKVWPHGAESVILDAAAAGPYETRGSLSDWQAGIGSLTSGHALPVFAVSAALAGPLLHLAEQEGGGINFYGASSIGKTTLLRGAASVWGEAMLPVTSGHGAQRRMGLRARRQAPVIRRLSSMS